MREERDIISTLREIAPGVLVGSQMDSYPGATRIDVRHLPEHPGGCDAISVPEVMKVLRECNRGYEKGDILITCKYGLSRAPAIAQLFCLCVGVIGSMRGSYINGPWRAFLRKYAEFIYNEWYTE